MYPTELITQCVAIGKSYSYVKEFCYFRLKIKANSTIIGLIKKMYGVGALHSLLKLMEGYLQHVL